MIQTDVRAPASERHIAPPAASPSASPAASPAASGRRWPTGSRAAIVHALLLILLLPVGGMLAAVLISPHLPAPDSHRFDGSMGAFVRQTVQLVVGVGVFCVIGLLLVGRMRWRDLGWRDLSLAQVALGVGGFAITAAVFAGFLIAATDMALASLIESAASFTWRERLLGLLIGITASIVEESLFRGYLQPSLCKRLGTAGGVVITALLFSLTHVPGTIVAFLGRLIIGLGLGVLRGQDRPLWAPAIAHTLIWVILFAL